MGKVTKLNLEQASLRDGRRLNLRDVADGMDEQPTGIGARLRAARLARGEELASVASQLRLRRGQLEAIERSDYDRLPGPAYTSGFIKSYAAYLGLDAREAAAAFRAECEAELAPAAEGLSFPDTQRASRLPRGTAIVGAVLAIAAIYGAWVLTSAGITGSEDTIEETIEEIASASASPARSVPSPVPEPSIPAPELSPSPTPALAEGPTEVEAVAQDAPTGEEAGTDIAPGQPAEAVTADTVPEIAAVSEPDQAAAGAGPAASAGPPAQEQDQISALESSSDRPWEGFVYGQQNHDSRVVLRAAETVWMRVEDADGNVLLSRTLRAGESYRAPDRPGMVLATRNAGAIEIYLDGSAVGKAGVAGEVIADLPLDPAALSRQ